MFLKRFFPIFMLLFLSLVAKADDTISVAQTAEDLQMMALMNHFIDSVNQALDYSMDAVEIAGGMATINLPKGYKYLNSAQTKAVLTDIWGNPSSQSENSLGVIVPEDWTPFKDSSYAINITAIEDGFISDFEASKIDYDEMLVGMQEAEKQDNDQRVSQGFEAVHLVGWASPPYYDKEAKKLHWAKELKFGDSEENTLNYNIRVLGRKGYLELNAIGDMSILDDVKRDIDDILNSVNFNEGNKYSDFNPKIDKIAKYGIGALVAGKVIAKVGILAKLGIYLAKFWKVIVLFFAGVGSAIRKFFGGKSKTETTRPVISNRPKKENEMEDRKREIGADEDELEE